MNNLTQTINSLNFTIKYIISDRIDYIELLSPLLTLPTGYKFKKEEFSKIVNKFADTLKSCNKVSAYDINSIIEHAKKNMNFKIVYKSFLLNPNGSVNTGDLENEHYWYKKDSRYIIDNWQNRIIDKERFQNQNIFLNNPNNTYV